MASSNPAENRRARIRARRYSRAREQLALVSVGANVLLGAAWLASGAARAANQRLLPKADRGVRRQLGYGAVSSLLSWLPELPFGYLSGYALEHQYGLSVQTRRDWLSDQAKGKALSLPLELALIEGIYAALRRWPSRWWLVCAGAVVPLTAGLAQLFPVLIAPRFNRYEPLRDAELTARLTALAARAEIAVADVQQMDMSRRTSKANAFFTGIGPTKRIVLADTLLEQFSPEEIEGIVAHEAGHQAHRDIWRFIALAALSTLASAWAVDKLASFALQRWPGLTDAVDIADRRSLPVLGYAFALVGLALGPAQLAYSRRVERQADAFAVNLTGNAQAYAGALRRLSESNLADPQPSRLITVLLHSHPPLGERISAAERIAAAQIG